MVGEYEHDLSFEKELSLLGQGAARITIANHIHCLRSGSVAEP